MTHPDVQKLLRVQEVDQKAASLRRDVESLPAEQEKRERRLQQIRDVAQEARTRHDRTALRIRELESSVKGADANIAKLEERRNKVANNAEYQAVLFQIEDVKKQRNDMEDEVLALLDQVGGLKSEAEDREKELAEEQADFDAFLAEADKLRSERDAQIAEVVAGREELVAEIPRELLDTYERVFRTRGSLAVCVAEQTGSSYVCSGCYTGLKPNDVARLKGASSIVQCGPCQRILYLL